MYIPISDYFKWIDTFSFMHSKFLKIGKIFLKVQAINFKIFSNKKEKERMNFQLLELKNL